MGRITARDLVRTGRGRIDVVIADRERPASPIPGVSVVPVDVTDAASLRRALAGAWATIASLPYRFNLVAMEGALAAGTHYLDLGGLFHMTRRQLPLARAFARGGRMAILGIGSAPGILNVLAARAARDLETVSEVHCLVGASDRTRYREAPPLGFGYSVDTLLDEFSMPSAVFRDGAWRMVPALDPHERIEVRFPRRSAASPWTPRSTPRWRRCRSISRTAGSARSRSARASIPRSWSGSRSSCGWGSPRPGSHRHDRGTALARGRTAARPPRASCCCACSNGCRSRCRRAGRNATRCCGPWSRDVARAAR
jgi:hypothetical protein